MKSNITDTQHVIEELVVKRMRGRPEVTKQRIHHPKQRKAQN